MRAGILALLLLAPAVALGDTNVERARALASEGKLDEAQKLLDEAIPRLAGAEQREARRLRGDVLGRRPDRASFERARDLLVALAREDEEETETRWVLDELLWSRGERLLARS